MANIIFQFIQHDSEEYKKAVALRHEILRAPLGLEFSKKELQQEQTNIHIVGIINQTICATAVLAPDGKKIKMRQVAIKQKLQGKDIGSQLLKFCENYAVNTGYEIIYCHARETAISFYLRNGYKPIGEKFLEVGILHQKMYKKICLVK